MCGSGKLVSCTVFHSKKGERERHRYAERERQTERQTNIQAETDRSVRC